MSDSSSDEAVNRTSIGNLKDPTADPEPLVGAKRTGKKPVAAVKRVVKKSSKASTSVGEEDRFDSDKTPQAVESGAAGEASHEARSDDITVTEGHGAQAVIDASVDTAEEADDAEPKDQPVSAEAVDQGNVIEGGDVQQASLDAASHAERLQRVEDEVGPETVGVGIMVAGDREGDHVHNVKKAAQAADDAPDNVKRARAFAALEDKDRVDSPHGRVAEEHDAWQGERWAPHGDLNVPAVSFGPEDSGAIYGPYNPAAHAILRGVEGDDDASVERVRENTKGAESIADTRDEENRQAEKIGEQTVSTPEGPTPLPPKEESFLYSDIYGK